MRSKHFAAVALEIVLVFVPSMFLFDLVISCALVCLYFLCC